MLWTLLETVLSSRMIWAARMAFKRLFRRKLSPKMHAAVRLILVARLAVPATFDTGLRLIRLKCSGRSCPLLLPVWSAQSSPLIRPQNLPHLHLHRLLQLRWNVGPAELAAGIWLLGVLFSADLSVRTHERMRSSVLGRLAAGTGQLHRLFQECLAELGIRSRVALAVQHGLASPALLFPNIVLVPAGLGPAARASRVSAH